MESSEEPDFQVLLATDCHLGFADEDGERCNDSLNTFEEILKIAKERDVDFILLGGDLFHENKPSRRTLHRCMQLIRQYCMGDKPIGVEVLSDQSENFKHSAFPNVNYEDPNLNISIPIFSIHGNHDDPCGSGSYSPVDLLSVSGLINYFGQQKELSNICIMPVLFQKGSTKLAIYGLGAIREERLHRLFLKKKVTLARPAEDADDWFNIFVIHQNRVKHGPTNYIPEEFLDSCIDLVIWGHEHECRIEPEYNSLRDFYVTQPGSSVATSLCQGETVKKHIGLLKIHQKQFKIEPIPLQTVRPFYMESLDLNESSLDVTDPKLSENVFDYCCERIDELVAKAGIDHTGNPKQPKKPLIRLRIEFSEPYKAFNPHRIGQMYIGEVANPKDMVVFHRKRDTKCKKRQEEEPVEMNILFRSLEVGSVESQIQEYFESVNEHQKLTLLSEKSLGQALRIFVEKLENAAIPKLINDHIEEVQKHLKDIGASDDTMSIQIENYKKSQFDKREIDSTTFLQGTSSKKSFQFDSEGDGSDMDANDKDGIASARSAAPPTTRGRGRGRGKQPAGSNQAGGGRGRGRGRGGGSKWGSSTPKRRGTKAHDALSSSEGDSLSENESFSTHTRRSNRNSARSGSRKRGKGVTFSDDD